MTAEIIAKSLGARRVGGGWIACCPAHEDRKPSFSITEAKGGKVLVRCHAGYDQGRRKIGIEIRFEREGRARTALGGSVANLHALTASPRDGWMTCEIPHERFEEAAE